MLIRFFVLLAIYLGKVCNPFSIMLFCMVMQGTSFIVLGTISEIVDEDGWWYTACSCNKKVYADSNMYFCEKCDRHVVHVTPRYMLT